MRTFLHVRAIAHYIANDLEQAEADLRAALRQPYVTFYPYVMLLAVVGKKGRTEKTKKAVAELLRMRPGFTCESAVREWYFGDHPVMTRRFLDQFAADVRNSGLPE